jgi:hypothetical protein
MSTRASRILGWVFTLPLIAMHLFALWGKFAPIEPGSQADLMNKALGMEGLEMTLATIEILVLALFLIPRTSTIGFVLMTGYMGGVLATMMTHGMSSLPAIMPILVLLVFLGLSGYFRNPEVFARLRGKAIPA